MNNIIRFILTKLLRNFGLKIVRYESLPYNKRFLQLYENFHFLVKILEKNSIKGQFVECGYGFGRSFAVLSHFSLRMRRKIYGFDSFKGFPNITESDRSIRNPKEGEWSVITLKEAKNSIERLGLFNSVEDYELMELVFDKNSVNPIPNEKIAFLHIDLDLYEGYKYALEIFWDQIQVGGVILFDEYDHILWPGATAAVNQFFKNRNISRDEIKKLNDKHYFIKTN
jgi:hypothetical protein